MTQEKIKYVKTKAAMLEQLLYKRKVLRETLEYATGTYAELKTYADELESVEDLLWHYEILDESDVIGALENQFYEVTSDTAKKLYYIFGYLKEADNECGDYYFNCFKKYLMFVPINSENKEYAWLLDVVAGRDSQLVKVSDLDSFRKQHYVIDGVEMATSYSDEGEYAKLRTDSYFSEPDYNVSEDYHNYRKMFFEELLKVDTEEEAVERTYTRSRKNGK